MMKILLTGDRGYIGSVLSQVLLESGYEVVGLDAGFFSENTLCPVRDNYLQRLMDIRDVSAEDLEGFDAVIHLAGLSNDPLGELSPNLTMEINYKASVRLAKLAQAVGVKRFVFASSQSMYGVSSTDETLDEELSEKNPVTAYAAAKWEAEQKLREMSTNEFVVTCFRPSTVFGVSPRLRTDIVFNNFVACAYTTKKIEIKSDGTPWRPVVHVRDVCSAFIAGLEAPASLVNGAAFNVGIDKGNYTVRDLAEAAQQAVPRCNIVFTGEHVDARTYRVEFSKILTELGDYYKPVWDLKKGGEELVEFFNKVGFSEADFRGRGTVRLKQLHHLMEANKVDEALRAVKDMEIA